MESKIRLTVIAIMSIINVVVLFGANITEMQLAGINTALLAVAAAVLGWFSPKVPVGPRS